MQRHPVYPLCRVPFMQDVTIKLQYNTYHNYNVNIDNIDIKTVKLQNISINISIPHVVLLQPLTLLPIPPLPEPLKTIPLFAIFIIFSVQEYFYIWNHTVSNLLELTFSFSISLWRCTQVVACIIRVGPFLLLSSSSRHGSTTFCLTIYLLKDM